jgi:RNA polymerase sigma-70 factor (ECF subfamily)
MTGQELEAEQILTKTFVQAFQAAEEPDARVVDTALVSELRERMPLGEVEPAAVPEPDTVLARRNVRRTDLEEGVQTLPPTERMVFLLHDVEGYAPDAIAALLELEPKQVHRSLISARIRLRAALAAAQAAEAAAA